MSSKDGMTDDEEKICIEAAIALKDMLFKAHVIHAPDMPNVEANKQVVMKLTTLILACDYVVQAATKLNARLDKKETDMYKQKDKEEWN